MRDEGYPNFFSIAWSAAAMPPLIPGKGGHAARPSRGMAARHMSGGMAAALRYA
ncbi:MAG TPA: hypothetical protein VJ901_22830 [Thermoanaerobaculia bacterium]|nr:hypothetical protein [Thermoanaerobaculia bacterium]